jgi:hypothetical protein
VSFARIKEMRKKDVIVAYQSAIGVMGLACLASDGYQHVRNGNFDSFNLASAPTLRFHDPIPYKAIRDISKAQENFEFVRNVKQGTVFSISTKGFADLVQLAVRTNPEQLDAIRLFPT